MTLHDQALRYAELGWPVFPLLAGKKLPRTAHGFHDATTDPKQIHSWWTHQPDANIGLPTGHHFDALDLDVSRDPGIANFQAWCEGQGVDIDHEELPVVRTPSGGLHLYFAPIEGASNRARMLPGVDWRALGGYVVAPGSVRDDGAVYEWAGVDGTLLAPMAVPPKLGQLVLEPKLKRKASSGRAAAQGGSWAGSGAGSSYGIRALDAEAERVRGATEGTRNHQLNTSAFALFQLVAGGELTASSVWDAMLDAAGSCGLGDTEARQTIRSAEQGGQADPRQAPPRRVEPLTSVVRRPVDEPEPTPDPEPDAAYFLPESFWDARDIHGMIRQAARARRCGPDGLLGVVLARIAWLTSPLVTLPPLVGGEGTLDFAVALCGRSGTGKSACLATGAELFPGPIKDDVAFAVGLGSGEGLVDAYMGTVEEPDPADPKKKLRSRQQTRTSGLFVLDEGAAFRELGERKGSTLWPTIRSAWVGAQLGQANATEERTRLLRARAYRFALVMGFQPELAMHLLSDTTAGTPQRFLWLPTGDPGAPDWDDRPPWPARMGGWGTDWRSAMVVNERIQRELDAAQQATLQGHVPDALDSHRGLLRLKLAALLAVLDGRHAVNLEDWGLADLVLQTSDATRSLVLDAGHRQVDNDRDTQADDFAERSIRAKFMESAKAADRAAGAIARHVWRGDCSSSENGVHTRACVWRAVSASVRKLTDQDDAISQGYGFGWIDVQGDDGIVKGETEPPPSQTR
jgi:hypothetical protein